MLKAYALFDFDGTLIAGDSIVRFLRFARRRGAAGWGHAARAAAWAAAYGLGLASAARAKEGALGFLAGRTQAQMQALAEAFCEEELMPRLRKQGVQTLCRLAQEGKSVLLLSASPSFYLDPLMRRLPLEGVIATRLHVEQGVYTGRLAGENCRGVQKPLRLAEYLAARGDTLDYAASWAFGDSGGDWPMLQLCAHRVAVHPRRSLRKRMGPGADVALWDEG